MSSADVYNCIHDMLQGLATGWAVPRFESRQGSEIFASPKPPRLAMWPNQPSAEWARRLGREVYNFHLAARLRMNGVIPPPQSHTIMRTQGQYFFL